MSHWNCCSDKKTEKTERHSLGLWLRQKTERHSLGFWGEALAVLLSRLLYPPVHLLPLNLLLSGPGK